MPQLKKSWHTRNLGAYARPQAVTQPAESATRHQSTPPAPSPSISPIPKPGTRPTLPISHFSIHQPPPQPVVQQAIPALEERVNPRRKSGVGHAESKLTPLALQDLTSILELFHIYVGKDITWKQVSIDVALAKDRGETHARTLRTWGRACLIEPSFTPRTSYGGNHDPLIKHDDFRKLLSKHLRSVGKYVTTSDVIQFTARPNIQEDWGLTKPVSKTTAKR
ncbi:hypothetical protein FRC06_004935 [Ceratobasidium sp. 370]|nr:hypothetical protein FRC06_004935 [Ceratobasidium sp. 370]